MTELFTVEDRGYETPCWIWNLYVNANGYGQVCRNGRTLKAHRWVYEDLVGEIGEQQVDHLCKERSCVNPDHMELVDNAENTRRGNRAKLTHEQAEAIKKSSLSTKDLTEIYGVSKSAIKRIRAGTAWN